MGRKRRFRRVYPPWWERLPCDRQPVALGAEFFQHGRASMVGLGAGILGVSS